MVSGFEEPVTAFRRDVVAEDDFRLRVEAIVADLLREERAEVAWAARRLGVIDQTYVSATSRPGCALGSGDHPPHECAA